MTQLPGVTVGGLLESRPETLGFDLEILAGSGLDRYINSPDIQKIALALAARLERQLQLAGMNEIDESAIEEIPDGGEET